MRLLLAAAIAIAALAPATAAALGTGPEAGMQAIYAADGSGLLFANGTNTSWERCNPDLSACEAAGTAQEIGTGNAAPGTVFRLAGTPTGPAWHGNLAVVAPPGIQGVVAANELVTPALATWQGGWEGSSDQTQLAACATPTGEGCVSISAHKYVEGCPGGGAVIDPSFVGDYLRVADLRSGPGAAETLEAFTSPYGHEIWGPAGNVAVAIVGQIGPANHGGSPACGPKPLVGAWISSRGVAKITCTYGCAATLVAGHAGRTARKTMQVPANDRIPGVGGTKEPQPSGSTLALSSGALKRLGGGKTSFKVEVGGKVFFRKVVKRPITEGRR